MISRTSSNSPSNNAPNCGEDKSVSSSPAKRRKLSSSPEEIRSLEKSFASFADEDLAFRAIENLNLAKNGKVSLVEFNLESIYAERSFEFEYGSIGSKDATKYNSRDVRAPNEKHASLLFGVLATVFSEPMNCGYFSESELEKIFSILTLSPKAQSLLARMLKRKRGWHKVEGIKYPEIAEDLRPVFDELVRHGIFENDMKNESVESALNLLHVDEIRVICRAMKVSHKGAKPALIGELAKLASRKNSLFPGTKSPSAALKERISGALGNCVRLVEERENLLDRVIVLLVPNQDPRESMMEVFRMLAEVTWGDKVFPPSPRKRFPVFRNREHLVGYAEARGVLTRLYNASEAKDWETVRRLGHSAWDRLQPLFKKTADEDSARFATLPPHVRRFEVNYTWTKVLWRSVEGFKKTKDGIETAAKFLHSLVRQRHNDYLGNPVRWYTELALIEMHHRKNLEVSADLTIEALGRTRLSENEFAELAERARKLLGRSKNISDRTKERLVEATRLRNDSLPNKIGPSGDYEKLLSSKPPENIIEATMVQGNTTGSKSTWSVGMGGTDVGYLRVEQIALLHYSGKGFSGGLHCEGALPVTLFAIVFWNEIYEVPVPGAFVSPYQEAPLDLYDSNFIEHRREHVESKLSLVRDFKDEDLGKMMREDYAKYRHYSSLVHGQLFEDADDFGNFIECLGTVGVVGICERLASHFNEWRSGFPDLAIWDPINKRCKFVEVKGPGDSLSTKQKLWIQFLMNLGVGVEVCIVEGKTRKYAV